EADELCYQARMYAVAPAATFANQLFPTVSCFGLGRISDLFLHRHTMDFSLTVIGINAGGRGIEITLDSILAGSFQCVNVNERIVMKDLGVFTGNETHAAHMGRERIDIVHSLARKQALIAAPPDESLCAVSL